MIQLWLNVAYSIYELLLYSSKFKPCSAQLKSVKGKQGREYTVATFLNV